MSQEDNERFNDYVEDLNRIVQLDREINEIYMNQNQVGHLTREDRIKLTRLQDERTALLIRRGMTVSPSGGLPSQPRGPRFQGIRNFFSAMGRTLLSILKYVFIFAATVIIVVLLFRGCQIVDDAIVHRDVIADDAKNTVQSVKDWYNEKYIIDIPQPEGSEPTVVVEEHHPVCIGNTHSGSRQSGYSPPPDLDQNHQPSMQCPSD